MKAQVASLVARDPRFANAICFIQSHSANKHRDTHDSDDVEHRVSRVGAPFPGQANVDSSWVVRFLWTPDGKRQTVTPNRK